MPPTLEVPSSLQSKDTVHAFIILLFFKKLAVIANAVNSTPKLPDGAVLRLQFHVIAAATLHP